MRMKKRTFIFSGLGIFALLALVSFTLYGRGPGKAVYLDERLKPGEFRSIQQDLRRTQWAYAGKAAASGHFLSSLQGVRNIAFCRVRGISRPFDGYVIVQTGYVWNHRSTWVYDLTLTTNGWHY